MIVLAVLLLACAAMAWLPLRPWQAPPVLLAAWWGPSWLGQSLALPLALTSSLLAVANLRTPVVATFDLAASGLFLLGHLRNRRDGMAFLAAVGSDARLPPLAGLRVRTSRAGTLRVRDIGYGPAGYRNTCDLVMPRWPSATPMPVLIHLPGGAWVIGGKDQQARPLLHHMARRGWLCLDINYRLGPSERFPAMVSDALRAVAWARANVARYGGDPNRIVLTGGSAGGHLSALAALLHDHAPFKPGFEDADCRLSAAVPAYGRYDFLDRNCFNGRNHEPLLAFARDKVMPPDATVDLWNLASPLAQARGDAPPMLVIHGRHDCMLPSEEARAFATALEQAGSEVAYVEHTGGQHAYDLANSALAQAHAMAIGDWLEQKVRLA